MSAYTPTIGLEIHAELKTRTKMFCGSKNDPDEVRPNVNVCPVCMGFPGTLPVPNREAVKKVLQVGVAAGGSLADYTEFDRKNYFYPDLPKGYQISQYQYPLVSGGIIADVQLTRIHLEEDTARSLHDKDEHYSIIDFNRSGMPLMELVTEPVIHDAKIAAFFAQELQRLLRALGAGEANMEKGQMRVEANISISKSEKLGTKVEVKNINSFRAVEKAIAYEIDRQAKLLERGEKVVQETRGWDENRGVTFSQRLKEESHDYRYFPEPDIPKFHLSRIPEFSKDSLKKSLPELPWEKRERYQAFGLSDNEIEMLITDSVYADMYEKQVATIANDKARKVATNLLLTNVRGLNPSLDALRNIDNDVLSRVAEMYVSGSLSSTGASALLGELLKEGGDPERIAGEKGLLQVHDTGALSKVVEEIIAENPKVAQEVQGGKIEALKYLIGQGMKKSKGSANPSELERLFTEKLKG